VLRCRPANLTAPQIGGECCVWNKSRRTDLREPNENHPDGAIPNHLPASDRSPMTAMTLKVSGRAYTLGAGLLAGPSPVTSSSRRR
jgi:hypothetical protein